MAITVSKIQSINNLALTHRENLAKQPRLSPDEVGRLVLETKRAYPYRGLVDISVTDVPGFVMYCNNDDPVALSYFWMGKDAWESFALSWWVKLLRLTSGSVLDVGAFSGLYSLVAASLGKVEIIAVEASRMPLGRLLDNINSNAFGSKISIIPKAISNHSGQAVFNTLRPIGTLSTGGSLESAPTGADNHELVMVTTLDEALADRPTRIGLIKIDVEGSELDVLDGMRGLIDSDRPVILIELKSSKVAEAETFFSSFGYTGNYISEETTKLLPLARHIRTTQNYLFVPIEQAAVIVAT